MARSFIGAAFLIVSAILFVGCSNNEGSGNLVPPVSLTPPVVADVNGLWRVQATATAGTQLPVGRTFSFVMTLSQVGSTVSGTVMNSVDLVTDVTGLVNGQILTFTLTQGAPCAGSFSGAGTASNGDTVLTGSYSGSDCNGTLSADFTATIKGAT